MKLDEIKKLSFEERIEWVEDYLDRSDNSDDFKPLLMHMVFSDVELSEIKTMTKRLKNLKLLLDK